jgi:hypothetical protein
LCGDWNINLLQSSPHAKEVPSRITKTTASLLDVVITNEEKYINSLRVMDLGLSDHHAQSISISLPEFNNTPYKIKKRKFNEANTQEFLHLLNQVTWQEVYGESETNAKFSAFMDVLLHCYNTAFPIKTVLMRNSIKNNWITQGIKTSSKRMRLLDKQRKTKIIKKEDLEYIEQYRKIYKRVIQDAKR